MLWQDHIALGKHFLFNSSWPSDAICQHRYILVQVMACCLTAPSHYLNRWGSLTCTWEQFHPDIDIYRWEGYQSIDMSISGQISISVILVVSICSTVHRKCSRIQYLTWIRKLHFHYDDIIMGAIASKITGIAIVYYAFYLGADQRKHQSSASLAFVPPVPGEFPAQRASNTENVSSWWHNHVSNYCHIS